MNIDMDAIRDIDRDIAADIMNVQKRVTKPDCNSIGPAGQLQAEVL